MTACAQHQSNPHLIVDIDDSDEQIALPCEDDDHYSVVCIAAVPERMDLLQEVTPFLQCYDVVHHSVSFLPLEGLRTCSQVNSIFRTAAKEAMEGTLGEIHRFVVKFNEDVEHEGERRSVLSQTSKRRVLLFMVTLYPASIMPLVFFGYRGRTWRSITPEQFDIVFSIMTVVTFASIALYAMKIFPHLDRFVKLLAATLYVVAMACYACYLLEARFGLIGYDNPFRFASGVTILYIPVATTACIVLTGLLVQTYFDIRRKQIRHPVNPTASPCEPPVSSDSVMEGRNDGWLDEALRRQVSIEVIESMMKEREE